MESQNIDHTSYRFKLEDIESWRQHLHNEGFVVISDVISKDDCRRNLQEMKICLSKLSPNLKDDHSFTVSENYPPIGPGGMVTYVGHTKFQWELREKAAPVFSKVWNCSIEDLAASFDGFLFVDGRTNQTPIHPLQYIHIDQSPKRDYLWTVQGVLNLCDSDENDGGLVVIPKSHQTQKEIMNRLGKGDLEEDWHRFSEEEKKDEVFKNYLKVCSKAGDLTIWDSRLINSKSTPLSKNTLAWAYICEVPKERVTKEAKAQRLTAWKEKRCTNHAPGDGFVVSPVLPKKGEPILKERIQEVSIGDEELTDLQKSLLYV